MSRLDRIEDLPGLKRVAPQRSTSRTVLAALTAAAWPPLIVTLIVWPPENWASGVDTDWRLVLLVLGLIAAPVGLWMLRQTHARAGRPSTRLGVVKRETNSWLWPTVMFLYMTGLAYLASFATYHIAVAMGAG